MAQIIKKDRVFPCLAIEKTLSNWGRAHKSIKMTILPRGRRFTPRDDLGQVIKKGNEKSGYCREILRVLKPSTYTLHFAVYPDSYAAFLQLLDLYCTKLQGDP